MHFAITNSLYRLLYCMNYTSDKKDACQHNRVVLAIVNTNSLLLQAFLANSSISCLESAPHPPFQK